MGDESSQETDLAVTEGSGQGPPGGLVRDGVVDRPSERALWRAVAETLRTVVLDHVDDPYARVQTERLIGLAEYAMHRGPDPSAARRSEIAGLLDGDDPTSVLLTPGDPRRGALRALLLAHLDDDLAVEEELLTHFPAPGNDRAVPSDAVGPSGRVDRS